MTKITYNPELRLFSVDAVTSGINLVNYLSSHAGLIMSRSNPELGQEILDRLQSMDKSYLTIPIGKASRQFNYKSSNDINGQITECFYNFDGNINVNHLLNKRPTSELIYDNDIYELRYLGDLRSGNYESQVFWIHNKKNNDEYIAVDESIVRDYIEQYVRSKNTQR